MTHIMTHMVRVRGRQGAGLADFGKSSGTSGPREPPRDHLGTTSGTTYIVDFKRVSSDLTAAVPLSTRQGAAGTTVRDHLNLPLLEEGVAGVS